MQLITIRVRLKVICRVSNFGSLKKDECYIADLVEINSKGQAFFRLMEYSSKFEAERFELVDNIDEGEEIVSFKLNPPLEVQARENCLGDLLAGKIYNAVELRVYSGNGPSFFKLQEVSGAWYIQRFIPIPKENKAARYEHDCASCIYLGQDQRQQGEPPGEEYVDLWAHFGPSFVTLIRRYSSAPSDYSSTSLDNIKRREVEKPSYARSRWTVAVALALAHLASKQPPSRSESNDRH